MSRNDKPSLASRIRPSGEVLFQTLEDESVLLNLKSGVYLGLDPVGTRIWQLMDEHDSLAEIAGRIVAEYDVTPERCEADLLTLVADMERHGLVEVS
jgi:hypothetical protein